jgi:hypothetical protein
LKTQDSFLRFFLDNPLFIPYIIYINKANKRDKQMIVTATQKHATQRLQERVNPDLAYAAFDLSKSIYTRSYTHDRYGCKVKHYVTCIHGKPAVLVVDTDTNNVMTILTYGPLFDIDVSKAAKFASTLSNTHVLKNSSFAAATKRKTTTIFVKKSKKILKKVA